MRMSCNGCRVLRKGCSDDCSIRPCLQWITSPDSQANATVFLAKFYGRAGLMNLINNGPEHLRPALFRSLLYEACGRIVNPIYGSVGLLWSGKWQLCQDAVEAVLKGSPIVQLTDETTNNGPPLKAYDIRHMSKDENSGGSSELHRVPVKTRCRFKRTGTSKMKTKQNMKNKTKRDLVGSGDEESGHESTLSHQSELAAHVVEGESHEPPEVSAAAPVKPERDVLDSVVDCEDEEIGLELRLGLEPVHQSRSRSGKVAGGMEVGLDRF